MINTMRQTDGGHFLRVPRNWLCQAAGIAPWGVTAKPAPGGLSHA